MDIVRKGGPDHFCAIAHEKPGMKCTDFMHYEHALRAYIDTEAPHLSAMPNNIWRQIVNLLRDTVQGNKNEIIKETIETNTKKGYH